MTVATVTEERRSNLLEIVRHRGFASLLELKSELEVSESTVRRDVEQLEEIGVVKRTHGGVFYTGDSPQFSHFKDRQAAEWDRKQAIADVAAELVEDGDTLLLDGGSTTYEVARLLVGRPLQVVTNSMPVANLFTASSGADLIIIGGIVHLRTGVTMGRYADEMLSQLNVRRAIMSMAAINDQGCYNSNALLVATQEAMIRAADEVIAVVDSTKFGHSSLARVCELSEIDRMVVDDGISDDWAKRIKSTGVTLTIAERRTEMRNFRA